MIKLTNGWSSPCSTTKRHSGNWTKGAQSIHFGVTITLYEVSKCGDLALGCLCQKYLFGDCFYIFDPPHGKLRIWVIDFAAKSFVIMVNIQKWS